MEALPSSEGLLFALMQQEPETDANQSTLEFCERRPHLALDAHAFGNT